MPPARTTSPACTSRPADSLCVCGCPDSMCCGPLSRQDLWASQNDIVVHSLIRTGEDGKLWKLLLGQAPQAIWTGPQFPNATTLTQPAAETVFGDCGFSPGCLFELQSDPSEYTNVAADNPDIVTALRRGLELHNSTVFAPYRTLDPRACQVRLLLIMSLPLFRSAFTCFPGCTAVGRSRGSLLHFALRVLITAGSPRPARPRPPHGLLCKVALTKYKDPTYAFGWWGPWAG